MGRTSGGGSGVAKSRTQLSMHACHSHLLSPGRSGHYDCLPINIGHSVTLRIFCNAMFSSCMMWKLREDSFGIYLPFFFLVQVELPFVSSTLFCFSELWEKRPVLQGVKSGTRVKEKGREDHHSIKNLRTIGSNQHPKNGLSSCPSSPLILFIDKFALTRSLVTFSWELTIDILIHRTSFETFWDDLVL